MSCVEKNANYSLKTQSFSNLNQKEILGHNIVSISGEPGSGKTSFINTLVNRNYTKWQIPFTQSDRVNQVTIRPTLFTSDYDLILQIFKSQRNNIKKIGEESRIIGEGRRTIDKLKQQIENERLIFEKYFITDNKKINDLLIFNENMTLLEHVPNFFEKSKIDQMFFIEKITQLTFNDSKENIKMFIVYYPKQSSKFSYYEFSSDGISISKYPLQLL